MHTSVCGDSFISHSSVATSGQSEFQPVCDAHTLLHATLRHLAAINTQLVAKARGTPVRPTPCVRKASGDLTDCLLLATEHQGNGVQQVLTPIRHPLIK